MSFGESSVCVGLSQIDKYPVFYVVQRNYRCNGGFYRDSRTYMSTLENTKKRHAQVNEHGANLLAGKLFQSLWAETGESFKAFCFKHRHCLEAFVFQVIDIFRFVVDVVFNKIDPVCPQVVFGHAALRAAVFCK